MSLTVKVVLQDTGESCGPVLYEIKHMRNERFVSVVRVGMLIKFWIEVRVQTTVVLRTLVADFYRLLFEPPRSLSHSRCV